MALHDPVQGYWGYPRPFSNRLLFEAPRFDVRVDCIADHRHNANVNALGPNERLSARATGGYRVLHKIIALDNNSYMARLRIDVLAEKRVRAGHPTQVHFARALGVAPVTYNRWERGHQQPSTQMLLKIARALDLAITDLLTDDAVATNDTRGVA